MITLYMTGTAAVVDGVYVDYIVVDEYEAKALIAAGWCENASDLEQGQSEIDDPA